VHVHSLLLPLPMSLLYTHSLPCRGPHMKPSRAFFFSHEAAWAWAPQRLRARRDRLAAAGAARERDRGAAGVPGGYEPTAEPRPEAGLGEDASASSHSLFLPRCAQACERAAWHGNHIQLPGMPRLSHSAQMAYQVERAMQERDRSRAKARSKVASTPRPSSLFHALLPLLLLWDRAGPF